MRRKTVVCLIDGFNLYHGIRGLNQNHLKWLNLQSLAASLIDTRKETLAAVYYFSAYATWLPDPYARHRRYVAALEATGVTPVLAHFKEKPRKCPCCHQLYSSHEEKESDVRIAVHLIRGVCRGEFDKAVVISADSDLVPAIEAALKVAPDKEKL
ncbi:MAG: NYN domain-containing protein [Nitrospinota bacterium]